MHPARSIIIFTTLSGAGYGLVAVLGLGLLPADFVTASLAYLLALVLIISGLLSSSAHLGRPGRAWRALSQWRSSWLSREGVLAIVTFIPIVITGFGAIFFSANWPVIGAVTAALAAATVYSTSMIYASLKPVAHWHSRLTPLVFLGFSGAGGLVAASAVSAIAGVGSQSLFVPAGLAVAGAWVIKAAWWQRAGQTESSSTIGSATGLGEFGQVHQLEAPHTNDNYLTSEMGHQVARKHAVKLRRIAVALGGILPVLLLIVAGQVGEFWSALAASAALISHLAGVLVERWLFFAEAKHTVSLYYGAQSA